VVHPDRRRGGTGRALLEAARTAAGAAGDRLAVWAHGDLAGARALATAAGLHQVRALWRMSHDLTRLPPVGALPAGVVVRPFVVGADEGAWLEVNARAFARHPEQGRMVLADLRAREGAPWFRAEDLILAERHGALVGFVWLKVEPGEPVGELYVLGVDPRAQGGGLGAGLTRLALTHLADRGVRRVVLYTEGDNTAALRTYTAAGFSRDRVDAQYG
ncbi:MAG TPA: mycothiol synthase, partial [Actinotalea sp.]|nr:mycothiol synthase [Actinotalea sp.]